ncbi:MAG: PocR ligand-binding domain-containing protein [Candidatus Omnitrophica bacterium]|nr:PocR ligand-binding domain-containing protein [Candidatus Omnitrophota bacterium]
MQEKDSQKNQATVALKDLFNLRDWQKIQDNFAAVTDVSMRAYDAQGNLVLSPSFQPRLCQQLIQKSPLKEKLCGLCLPTFLGGKAIVDKNLSYSCLAGLHNFFVPIRSTGNKILGYIILGPVILIARKPKEEYLRFADELNIDFNEFWSAILEIKVVSLHYMQSLTQLIADVFEYTANIGALKTKEEMFEILLDLAMEVSEADIGSIMILNDKEDSLTIKNSRGLSEEVKKETKVNLGEGISGIAAEEGSSFLLDKNTQDSRIKPFLKRPYINSAMVLPLRLRDKIVGVINLGSRSSAVTFNQESIGMMQKLIGLVNMNISP